MKYNIPLFVVIFSLFYAPSLPAQSGTMVGTPALLTPDGRPMTMSQASLTFQAPRKPHVFQKDDLIYVHINDIKRYNNTANNQRRKRIETEAGITAWAKLAGLFKLPVAASTEALPSIGGELNHQTQNQGRLTREESMELRITCRITDIRDNGNLVIEGNRKTGIGEEGSIITVTGIVRPDTIGPDFKVSSDQVAEFVINEIPSGNVYDTVRRPWGTRFFEQFKPF